MLRKRRAAKKFAKRKRVLGSAILKSSHKKTSHRHNEKKYHSVHKKHVKKVFDPDHDPAVHRAPQLPPHGYSMEDPEGHHHRVDSSQPPGRLPASLALLQVADNKSEHESAT